MRWLFERQAAKGRTRVADTGRNGGFHHRRVVASFVNAGYQELGFGAAMRGVGATTTLQPDAWATDESTRTIEAVEVVVREPVDRHRVARYRDLAAQLISLGWTIRIRRVGYSTRTGKMRESWVSLPT